MQTLRRFPFVMAAVLAMGASVNAATNYVWQDSPNPTPPYSSWETAAHAIPEAVNAATYGNTVLVTNGTYGPISVDNGIEVRSVNGAQKTVIDGQGTHGCAYLISGTVSGFTLTNGNSKAGFGCTANRLLIKKQVKKG